MTTALRAKDIATIIAYRMRDSKAFARGWQLSGATISAREPRGLGGAAAASMLHWALAEANESEEHGTLAHDLLLFATGSESLEDVSVFGGWTGIGLAARFAAFGGQRYAQLQKTIREGVAAVIAPQLSESRKVKWSDQYELIAGYAGHYLLFDPVEDAAVREQIMDVFEWIVDDPHEVRWRLWNRYDALMTRPTGHVGVSHGIAGILAALCSSCNSERELALIDRTGSVLLAYAKEHETGLQWPLEVDDPLDNLGRMAWCHFGLGISVCLWNAGKLCDREDFLDAARRTMRFFMARHWREWQMPDYGLCHGIAGSAVLLRYLGREMNNVELLDVSSELFIELTGRFDESLPLGYEALLMGQKYTDPGFLTGSAGIALALLTLAGHCDESWLSCLGMARSRSLVRTEG